MSNISSANFKKSKGFQVWHNADIRPSYAIGGGLEVNRNGAEALELKNQIIKQAIDTYNRTKKPKAPPFKAKSYEWSLVVNLKESSTMHDLETLSAHFKDKYGFQCYQIAIHRDEGHIDELGNKQINHHAHLEFVTLDERTGKNRFRGEFVTAKGLRAVQTEVAEILGMERGVDKRLSGVKRIEPRIYARMKEQEKKALKQEREKQNKERKELLLALENEKQKVIKERRLRELAEQELQETQLNLKEVKARLEQERKDSKGQGFTKEYFRELSALKNQHYAEKADLEAKIEALKLKYHQKDREIGHLIAENKQLKQEFNKETSGKKVTFYKPKAQKETIYDILGNDTEKKAQEKKETIYDILGNDTETKETKETIYDILGDLDEEMQTLGTDEVKNQETHKQDSRELESESTTKIRRIR